MEVKEIDINTEKIKGYGICKKKSTTSYFLVVLPLRLTLYYRKWFWLLLGYLKIQEDYQIYVVVTQYLQACY